ncbi:glycosyltransferase family 39 protein [bacterium]|nr:glycosyltransferase family 39 protein [candidate division CSSED10-310 bacterium]
MNLRSSESTRRKLAILFPVGLGILLRSINLAEQSLWADEAYSVVLASQSFTSILNQQLMDSSPPLYYWLLRIWTLSWGTSEIAVRSLSALFSSLALITAASLVQTLTRSVSATIVTTSFIAFSGSQLYFAQETRMYAFASFLIILACHGIVSEHASQGKGWYVIPAMIGLIYTHNYGWIFWACAMVWTFFFHRRMWLYHIIIAVAASAWVPGLLSQLGRDPSAWIPQPRWIFILQTIRTFAGTFQFHKPSAFGSVLITVNVICLVILFVNALITNRINRLTGYLELLAFGPLITAFLLSFYKPMYVPGRYDTLFFIPLVVFTAAPLISGITGKTHSILPPLPIKLLVMILLIGQGCSAAWYHVFFVKANDREVAASIESMNLPAGSVVITTDVTLPAFIYYLDNQRYHLLDYPLHQKGWLPKPFLEDNPHQVEPDIARLLETIDSLDHAGFAVIAKAGLLRANDRLIKTLTDRWVPVRRVAVDSPRPYNSVNLLLLFRIPEAGDVPGRITAHPHP